MSHKVRNLLVAIGVAVLLLTAACTSASPAPAPAASEKKPAAAPAASSGDAAKGKTVFAANCASCHGQNAEGLVGPDLRKIGATRDRDFLTRWLGDPAAVKKDTTMPKVPLSDQDLKAVVDYLLTLK